MTLRGIVKPEVRIFDDYAHHPVEVQATLKALKTSAQNHVVAVFQPHRYTRLRDQWGDFLQAFNQADTVLVCDVYAAGEAPIDDINSQKFVRELAKVHKNVIFVPDFDQLAPLVEKVIQPQDVVVCLGAGSISAQSMALVKSLKGKSV